MSTFEGSEPPVRRAPAHALREFCWFGLKQAWACVFGGLMLALILLSLLFWPEAAPLHRYDALFLAALAIQALLLATRLESWDEARTLAVAAYVNFFSHHYIVDLRYVLIAASLVLYGPCLVHYRPRVMRLRMPLALGFALVALLIWIAENIGTFGGAWVYPQLAGGWHMVSLGKLGSRYLLMILSFVLVTSVNRPRAETPAVGAA